LDTAGGKADRVLLYVDQWEELYAQAPLSSTEKASEQHRTDVNRFIDFPPKSMLLVGGPRWTTNSTIERPIHGFKAKSHLDIWMPVAVLPLYFQRMRVAQHEREMIAQRTKDALQAAKARGVVLGNPKLHAVRDRAMASVKADADRFARNVAPIIREIQSDWRCITSRHCAITERWRRYNGSRWRLDGGSSRLNLATCTAFCER
jgi:hypothetical protein